MRESGMNFESRDAGKGQVLNDITQAIFAVSDHIPPSQKIEMDTKLIADLGLESVEIAGLLFSLNARYSESVSLSDFVVEVTGTYGLSDLSVGSIVDFITDSLRPGTADSVTVPEPGAGQGAHS
jgi:acyl carrier protein